jgi:hypothetical protein
MPSTETGTAKETAIEGGSGHAWRGDLVLGAVLVAAYAVVLLLDLSVPQPVDHSWYMRAADHFPSRPQNPINDHQYLRIGLIAPTALVMKFFGYSEVTYHTVPVMSGLLLVASVYAIGRLLFGRLVGALSAVALGCMGTIVVAGTELLPDLPGTALFTAAVALVIVVRERLLRHRRTALLVIGVLLGWSYLAREFIVFVWPLVVVLLWRRVGRLEWLWAFVPVALTGAGEMALNAHLYGDPFERLHASSELGDLPTRPDLAAGFHDLPLWVYLWRLPGGLPRLAEGPVLLLLLSLTLAAGIAVAVRRPGGAPDASERYAGVFALWVALLWVPLTLLGGVLDPDHPKLRLQVIRYWFPVFPALVLGGIAALWLAARALRRRAVVPRLTAPAAVSCAALAVVALSAFGRPGASGWVGSSRLSSDALPEFRGWLKRSNPQKVWADTELFRIMPIYMRNPTGHRIWHGRLGAMHAASDPAPGDYVVAYSVGDGACPHCGEEARAVLPSVPATWREVMTSRDNLLRVWRVE